MAGKTLLRLTTTGSVDDGKSTLIGRLLYETNSIYEDHYAHIAAVSHKRGQERVDLSLLLDGLAAEREQGITIDVAYRYGATAQRKFIIADTPGHEQYTRNMVTGASGADVAIILIDACSGVRTQSRRHGFLLSLLGINHLIVAVNKMDLVGYEQQRFEAIAREYAEFAEKLDIQDICFVPLSALLGDNVTTRSQAMGWYEGRTLLQQLEAVHVSADKNLVDFRFPVQQVIRPHQNFRGFAGTIHSGTISPGEEVVALPSGKGGRVESIVTWEGELEEASAGQAVVLTLHQELDISRGEMLVRKNNLPLVGNRFEALLCWMDEQPLDSSRTYRLKHTSRMVKASIDTIHYRIDVNTLHRERCSSFALNEIGRVAITTSQPLFFDPYRQNRSTGCFILIDSHTNRTVGAGMIRGLPRTLAEMHDTASSPGRGRGPRLTQAAAAPISRQRWEERNNHKAVVYWLSGLSGSGKSTIGQALVQRLFEAGHQVALLDGDTLRQGLCADLGFSDGERSENIRRAAHAARLFFEQGTTVVCTFISPCQKDRTFARSLIAPGRFVEVFVKCDFDICKQRDPKGLYRQALTGEIDDFTGVSSPYEPPQAPEVVVESDRLTPAQCVEVICRVAAAI